MEDIKIFAAQIDHKIYTIDLHSEKSLEAALIKMEKELFGLYKKGNKYCRIIFGIGSGTLKKNVLEELSKNPLVELYKEDESGGSVVVILS